MRSSLQFTDSITEEEAAIVKQKAFQEYELAFKSIRKVRTIDYICGKSESRRFNVY